MEVNFLDDFVKFVCKSSKKNSTLIESELILVDTWLLTNGANVGIVQLIGQAIRKRKLTKPQEKAVAIGVCNYGCVKNLNDFQRPIHLESCHPSCLSQTSNSVSAVFMTFQRRGRERVEKEKMSFFYFRNWLIRHDLAIKISRWIIRILSCLMMELLDIMASVIIALVWRKPSPMAARDKRYLVCFTSQNTASLFSVFSTGCHTPLRRWWRFRPIHLQRSSSKYSSDHRPCKFFPSLRWCWFDYLEYRSSGWLSHSMVISNRRNGSRC